MGQERRLEPRQAQRALPRLQVQVQRPALRTMVGVRIALEHRRRRAAHLQQAREHQPAGAAADDGDAR